MRKTLLAVALATVALLAPAATSAMAHDPILFVHGWSESESLWSTMIRNFEREGWTRAELNNWRYNTSQSNVRTASEVARKVEEIRSRTGAAKVDIISHSMGGLNTRYYLKNLGGTEKVDDWVSLGGPNHGTTTANLCFEESCIEMRIGSTFLTRLNEGDETPGTVNYGTWWSSCDEIINPDESVLLSGATNTEAGCVTHTGLTTNSTVFAGVREFVR
ncbi:MAG: triacylglycerol lipase [Actinobacteria bacterium]|nr:triacylglycerol lipase [Actinomycetota bacterium]